MEVYMDNAATKKMRPDTKEFILEFLNGDFGNPNSLHSVGLRAKEQLDFARSSVAKFINADKNEIVFTCSGSASNTLGVLGFCRNYENTKVFFSPTLHPSLMLAIEKINDKESLVVDHDGVIDLPNLESKLRMEHSGKILIVCEYANSEIGTIQPIKEICSMTHKYGATVYVDCTGSISTEQLDVKNLEIDMAGFSAHKLGSAGGCGVLYKKKHIHLQPLIYGTQENGLFGGTQNLLSIATLGHICRNYRYEESLRLNANHLVKELSCIEDTYLVGSKSKRLSNNVFICFKGVSGEALSQLLSLSGVYVSTGTACSSGSQIISNVLKAIGIGDEDARSCIRLTISGEETIKDIDFAVEQIRKCVTTLRKLN